MAYSPLPWERFPLKSHAGRSPKPVPDCHLVRTVIPRLPKIDSLGAFHNRRADPLASFADAVSRKYHTRFAAGKTVCVAPLSSTATQGRLHCTQHVNAPPYRFNPVSYAVLLVHKMIRQLSHNNRSPRKPGRRSHAIENRPKSLTPSTHPKLGVKSRHQGLHRYALQRIFRPSLRIGCSD